MRMVFWGIVLLVLLVTIYRQIIEPFLEGLRGTRKPYNEPRVGRKKKQQSLIDRSSMQEAEFKDITEK